MAMLISSISIANFFFSCKLPPSSKESVPVSLAPEYEVVCRVSFHFQKEDYVLFYKYLLINLIKQ